ncbi:hypothetical protein ARZXY2_3420 [Arthrobacter sp. ZXY-2]|nr:hypothetical protein ARZXY2_3420 [Arthrobacter sp. ZXY-2]
MTPCPKTESTHGRPGTPQPLGAPPANPPRLQPPLGASETPAPWGNNTTGPSAITKDPVTQNRYQ